jgi:hypothetical protein
MAEKTNPWAKEGERYTREFDNIRDFKFKDNHTHKIRILPNKEAGKLPFFGYTIHWVPQINSTKGRPVVHAIDKRCALCEYISEIWNEINRLKEELEMTDKSPEVVKLYKRQQEIRGNKKYDMNVLDRDDLLVKNEETSESVITPKRMAANKTVWQSIFDYAKNPKWGNPSDEEKGYDFEIVTEGEQERRSYEVMPDRDVSPLKKEEKDSVKRGYDLEKLRKFTASEDIADILKNAKPPFNELLDKLANSVEEEKPAEKKETKKEEPVEKKEEPAKEPKKAEKPVEKVEEKEEEKTEEAAEENEENNDDINNYECRGEHDADDEACTDCPVKGDCEKYQPYYKKAKELKIDVGMKRKIEDIIGDVKKTEEKKEEPKKEEGGDKIVKRKKLPF